MSTWQATNYLLTFPTRSLLLSANLLPWVERSGYNRIMVIPVVVRWPLVGSPAPGSSVFRGHRALCGIPARASGLVLLQTDLTRQATNYCSSC